MKRWETAKMFDTDLACASFEYIPLVQKKLSERCSGKRLLVCSRNSFSCSLRTSEGRNTPNKRSRWFSPVVAGYADAVVKTDAERSTGRLDGVVALKT